METHGEVAERGNDNQLASLLRHLIDVPVRVERSIPSPAIETTDEYSVFSYFVVPTYEFKQEILSRGANAEVLYPKELREEIKEEVKKMNKLYK